MAAAVAMVVVVAVAEAAEALEVVAFVAAAEVAGSASALEADSVLGIPLSGAAACGLGSVIYRVDHIASPNAGGSCPFSGACLNTAPFTSGRSPLVYSSGEKVRPLEIVFRFEASEWS